MSVKKLFFKYTGEELSNYAETFPVYSLVKSFISVLILKSVDFKILTLNDSLGTYIDEDYPQWVNDIKIESLLYHRSGLKDYEYLEVYRSELLNSSASNSQTDLNLIDLAISQGQGEAGTFFYSNIGYLFLIKILESVHNDSFESILSRIIIDPLKLVNTNLLFGDVNEKSFTMESMNSLMLGGNNIVNNYHASYVSHGMLISSINDLIVFFDVIFNKKFLSDEMTDLLFKPKQLNFPSQIISANYGVGLMGDANSPIGIFLGHDGGGPGFSISCYFNKFKGVNSIYVLVMGEEGHRTIDLLAKHIFNEHES